jgi:hypothetical protein
MCFNQGMGVILMREDLKDCCDKNKEHVNSGCNKDYKDLKLETSDDEKCLELEIDVDTSLAESRLGWICPLCFMVWSPDVDACDCLIEE